MSVYVHMEGQVLLIRWAWWVRIRGKLKISKKRKPLKTKRPYPRLTADLKVQVQGSEGTGSRLFPPQRPLQSAATPDRWGRQLGTETLNKNTSRTVTWGTAGECAVYFQTGRLRYGLPPYTTAEIPIFQHKFQDNLKGGQGNSGLPFYKII